MNCQIGGDFAQNHFEQPDQKHQEDGQHSRQGGGWLQDELDQDADSRQQKEGKHHSCKRLPVLPGLQERPASDCFKLTHLASMTQ
jgi:hypothetical protein